MKKPTSSANHRTANPDQALFEKNMEALRLVDPDSYALLSDYAPLSEIVAYDDGDLDIVFQGTPVYGEGARKTNGPQLEHYWRNPVRISLNKPKGFEDKFTNDFIKSFEKSISEAGMRFGDTHTELCANHLIVFGIGLAPHIDELVEKTNCYHLILVEPTPEFLYQSFKVYDWSGLLTRFQQNGRKIVFIISDDPQYIANALRENIRWHGICLIDGTYVYMHYKSTVFQDALDSLIHELPVMTAGFGYFDDEIPMITNTFCNLMGGATKTLGRVSGTQDVPAFVIGSGPSLDKDIEFIRDHQDRAVLLTCGTALRAVLSAGIQPDFHVELERIVTPLKILKDIAQHYDLDKITFMGSTATDPRIVSLFSKSVLYFREALTPHPLFGTLEGTLHQPGPVVGNAGFSMAQTFGFKDIYLFGMDLGARDTAKHHSERTDYFGHLKIEEAKPFNMVAPANFEGTIHTGDILYWAKKNIEDSIMVFPKHRYFNCSDGVKIEGAKPTPSGNITLGEPLNKTLIVSGIVGNMPVYTLDAFSSRWNKDDLVRQVGKFQDDILSLVKEMTTPGDKRSEKERLSSNCFEAILRVTRYFYPLSEKQDRDYAPKPDLITDHEKLLHETLENLYRGTLFMSMGTATYFLNRITDRKRLPELHSHLSQYLQETIGKMAEASIDTFTKLQAELEAVALPPNDAMERVQ